MNLIGVPVPPGFTITTEVCNEYFEKGKDAVVALLKDDVEKSIKGVEALMKSKFGDVENPLSVSKSIDSFLFHVFLYLIRFNNVFRWSTAGKSIYILLNPKFCEDIFRHILQHRVCKMNFFEKHGRMSGKMYKFAPKLVLLKRTWQERKKNCLYWRR
jgi:hypothetical protein